MESYFPLFATLLAAAAAQAAEPVFLNQSPLAPGAFAQLPLTSVTPRGWLRDQLQIQAAGLTGHLDEFWPDLGPHSAWLGGTGEGWERGPYYLDGLLPLAYLLDDAKLIAKARKWVDWTLEHQRPDGAIGPEKNLDWWPNMLMLKALTQYQEATGDARVVPLMRRYFAYQARNLDQRPLHEWAIFRWQDEALSVLWLYNRTGDKSLLDLARKLHHQGHDWEAQFANFGYTDRVEKSQATLSTHGVNNAMALKAAAVWYLLTNNGADREAAYQMLRELDLYHALPNGIFSADEHYAGRNPSQGTELCAVVEAMFSLETEMAILGDAVFGDRLEKIAFNPLPGTFTKDMWGHQYDQQPNQVMCTLADRHWATNGPDSNLFGLEPNFGCCTANMHQGWPKFAASLWMAVPGGGLAAVAYAPSEVHTTLPGSVPVSIVEDTEYPFRDRIGLTANPAKPIRFPLVLRIPGWAAGASVTVNGDPVNDVQPGRFLKIERTWNPGDRVELHFPMAIRVTNWYHNSIAVERGPLVYSLALGETWSKLKQFGPAVDWEVFPTTPWNYALAVNLANPAASFTVEEHPVTKQPFDAQAAPVVLHAKGRRLTSWELEESSAGTLPVSPVWSKQPEESLRLVPYGAAKLRITAFPYLADGAPPR
ncbi:MAG: beta-L-arabinofuranosidase domain-containing protein [Terracidiphilus sp.]